MNEKASSEILERYSKVAVIGAGVIGASWTAVFLAHGLSVLINDPRDDVEAVVHDYIGKASSTLEALGLPTKNLAAKLRFEADLARAVSDADLVQENGPERVEFKQDLWARIELHVPAHALLLSSSSAKTATEQSIKMRNPGRLLIGHPFNPHTSFRLSKSFRANEPNRRRSQTRSPFTRRLARYRGCCAKKSRGLSPTVCSGRSSASAVTSCLRAWSLSTNLMTS